LYLSNTTTVTVILYDDFVYAHNRKCITLAIAKDFADEELAIVRNASIILHKRF